MGAFSPDVIPEEIVLRHCFYEAFYRFHHSSSRSLPECFCRRQPEYSKSRISVHNLEYAERFHPQSRTSLPRSRTLETAPKSLLRQTTVMGHPTSNFRARSDVSAFVIVSIPKIGSMVESSADFRGPAFSRGGVPSALRVRPRPGDVAAAQRLKLLAARRLGKITT